MSCDLKLLDLYLWDHHESGPVLYSTAVTDVAGLQQK
jgi:hypothetical protein